jgi:hypothetical protein
MCISFLVQNEWLIWCDRASTVLHSYHAWSNPMKELRRIGLVLFALGKSQKEEKMFSFWNSFLYGEFADYIP